MKKRKGIYRIIIGEKYYIGSSYRMEYRIEEHIKQLMNKSHPNPYLQQAYNKERLINTRWEILEEVEQETNALALLALEQKYIKKYKSDLTGYNRTFCTTNNKSFVMKEELTTKEDYENYIIKFLEKHEVSVELIKTKELRESQCNFSTSWWNTSTEDDLANLITGIYQDALYQLRTKRHKSIRRCLVLLPQYPSSPKIQLALKTYADGDLHRSVSKFFLNKTEDIQYIYLLSALNPFFIEMSKHRSKGTLNLCRVCNMIRMLSNVDLNKELHLRLTKRFYKEFQPIFQRLQERVNNITSN